MTTDEQILGKLDALIAATRAAAMPIDLKLWDAEQIAQFLGVSKDHLVKRIVVEPQFPRPICLPTESGIRQTRRWKAGEVIDWANGRQARKRT